MQTIDKNIQQKINTLLGWHDDRYNGFVYETGVSYLESLAPEYPQVCSQIAKSERFWNWWKAHWELRDREFIESCEMYDDTIELRNEIYVSLHDPKTLAAAIYLNGQVLQESYANLIEEITKEQVYA